MSHSLPQLQYRMKREKERIAGHDLEIECLENLDRTIDEVFAYLERIGNPALLEELCPYFGVVWPSARALAELLAEWGRERLEGTTVLEVGCGLAVPSLLAARLGAHVTATDFHPEVPRFLERNRELNCPHGFLRYVHRDWRQAAEPLGHFDWVIGSDVLYESHHPPWVARALAAHAAPQGSIVIADPGRSYLQAFSDEMKRLGFREMTLSRTVRDDPPPRNKDVFLLIFSRSL